MKKLLLALVLIVLFSGVTFAEIIVPPPPINIDISSSHFEVLDSNKFRIRNLTAPAYPGAYRVDFLWEPNELIFNPTAVDNDSGVGGTGYLNMYNTAEVVIPPPPIDIDISNSYFEILGPNKFRIRNLTAPAYPGVYQVDFLWDPVELVFVPFKASNDEDNVANYSGTFYVNLASQPRWMMYINHSDNNVTFTMDGAILIEGEGTVSDNTMTLTAEIDSTVNIFITFSEDGQSFSGTWDFIDSNGTITGTKSPWVTYDVDINGIPQFVSTDIIELQKISDISKFRSGAGHDYSDDFESCRNMKHYFIPKNDVEKLSIMIVSPINGTVIGTTDEWTEESVSKGTMISIESEDYPAFHIIIFHVDLIKTLNVGDKIVAGQVLGSPADYENVTISDTAVGVNTPSGYKLVSYFEVITDSLFQSYQARGLSSRDDVIISKEERDADPITCVGEIFTNNGNLENWVILN